MTLSGRDLLGGQQRRTSANIPVSRSSTPQRMIDGAILIATLAVYASGQIIFWFHIVFLLLVVSAFRLGLVPLVMRSVPAVTAVTVAVYMAWVNDEIPGDELLELPIQAAMIAIVHLTASRRQRLTDEIADQRSTIETLHNSARRELKDQLLLSQQLQVTNRLNSTVVHDVNNILAGMQIAAETLSDRADDQPYVRATGAELEQYTQQAGQIINELLMSARMANDLKPKPMASIGQALMELRPLLLRLCGNEIELIIEGCDVEVTTDLPGIRFEQILANLVANAVDAMPPAGGSITVTASVEHDSLTLQVSDTGTGIDHTLIGKVFEPYFTTKQDKQRSGLGLFAVRQLLTEAGGSISVESAPGANTTFTISLPARIPAD